MNNDEERVNRLSKDVDSFEKNNDMEAIREYLDVLDQDYGEDDYNSPGFKLLTRVQKILNIH